MKEALMRKYIKEDKIQCTACNHYCKPSEGKTGKCGIRKNIEGKLYLLTYGQALGINVDPIEKKPLFHFLPGSKVFSLGTAGCNFKCDFCQNFPMSQVGNWTSEQLETTGTSLSPEQIVDYCQKENIPSIAYTYNEPTVFFEYAYDTMLLAREKGIKNVFVSNGFFSRETREKLKNSLDAINIDLKSFSEEFYKKRCKGSIGPVLENIQYIQQETDIWMEITTLIIPGHNDSEEEIQKIAQFLKDLNPEIPWHISAFSPGYKMKDVPPTPMETLQKAYRIGKQNGLKYIYLGNVPAPEYQSTFCPSCGENLITRGGYSIQLNYQKGGECPECQQKINGVFE